MSRPEDHVTVTQIAKVVGRKPSTVAYWVSMGYLNPVGTVGGKSKAVLYSMTQAKRVAAKMPASQHGTPPEGYLCAFDAAAIMEKASQTVLKMCRDGRIEHVKQNWGGSGRRFWVFVKKSAAEEFARENQAKKVTFINRGSGKRGGTVDIKAPPRKEEVIERPLIYFRDSICLPARRARFETRGGKLAKEYTQNSVVSKREVG